MKAANTRRGARPLVCALAALALSTSCRQDMHDAPYYEPMEVGKLFEDGRADRPQVDGTVARGELNLDTHLFQGRIDGEFTDRYPFAITAEVLDRGEERYGIFCSQCHGHTGYGDGVVAQRGLKKEPASYHIARLREAPAGYFFDVITNGFGSMYDHADRIRPEDRWAIVAWIRTLQLSQDFDARELDAQAMAKLRESGTEAAKKEEG